MLSSSDTSAGSNPVKNQDFILDLAALYAASNDDAYLLWWETERCARRWSSAHTEWVYRSGFGFWALATMCPNYFSACSTHFCCLR